MIKQTWVVLPCIPKLEHLWIYRSDVFDPLVGPICLTVDGKCFLFFGTQWVRLTLAICSGVEV